MLRVHGAASSQAAVISPKNEARPSHLASFGARAPDRFRLSDLPRTCEGEANAA